MSDEHGFSTRAIHAGQEADALTGAVVPPIYQVSTYKQDGIGGFRGGYEYCRSANPTRTALEECIAALEGGSRGFAFASGLAGQDTLLRALLVPGDHVVVPNDAYGGTYRLFNKVAKPQGIEHSIADMGDLDAVRAAIRPGQHEDGLGRDADQPAARHRRHRGPRRDRPRGRRAARRRQHLRHALPPAARSRSAPTSSTHSTTKYCGGHSDVVGGAVVTATDITVPGSTTPRSGSPSTRTRSAAWPARSTRG